MSRINKIDKPCIKIPKMLWKTLESLGPSKTYGVPLDVYDEDSDILEYVKHKWKTEY